LLPLAAAGLAIFWIPYQVTGRLARRATDERDVAATAKVFVGAAVYVAWLVGLVVLVWQVFGGRAAGAAALLLPILAVCGLFAVERESAMIDTARSWLILRRARGQSRARLKQERSEIAGLLDDVYQWLNAETPAPGAVQRPS
jgi:hypothetical protein